MGVNKKLPTGIRILSLLNHIGQIVMGLVVVPMDAMQSLGLDKDTQKVGNIVYYPFIPQDSLIH